MPTCVLQVVGEGFHPKAGMPHAEVYALRGAGGLVGNGRHHLVMVWHAHVAC